jgi:capsular polysaccharide biosynthesis protein
VAIRRLVTALSRHLLLIVVTVAVAAAVGYHKNPPASHDWVATSRLLVGLDPGQYTGNEELTITRHDSFLMSQAVSTLPVATAAVTDAGVDRSPAEVAGATVGLAYLDTVILDVKVRDRDPLVAVRLADAMPQALTSVIDGHPSAPSSPVDVRLLVPATPVMPSDTGHRLGNVGLAALFGLLIGVAAALVIERVEPGVRSAAALADRVGLPVLGVVAAGPAAGGAAVAHPVAPPAAGTGAPVAD